MRSLCIASCNTFFYAPVAQLDRVLDSESKGRAFESRRVHHLFQPSFLTFRLNSPTFLKMVIIAMGWPGEKLYIKMWETLAEKGMGKLLTPRQIRLEEQAATDAEIDRTLRLAQAKVHEQAILRGELIANLSFG